MCCSSQFALSGGIMLPDLQLHRCIVMSVAASAKLRCSSH
jgi:hypothetical protein